ncbi:MAG: glycosyltransferase family 2 protein [Actinomycetota bacterium]|nr:glycosyltransferase family 2 protein [Actinomycetota bacterium]
MRNGERTLRRALGNIVAQTYTNLEILISDNCSTDGTLAIIEEFAREDPRIRCLQQPKVLTAWQHFCVVAARVRTEYLMWAADDDLRGDNYIEELVAALESHPKAVLAFGSVVQFYEDDDSRAPVTSMGRDYGWDGDSRFAQVAGLFRKCARFYGLHRTSCVHDYPWWETDTAYGPDVAFLLYARMRGEFLYVPGPVFYQAVPRGTYSAATRARDHYFSAPPRLALVLLAWCCTKAATVAARLESLPPRRFRTLVLTYCILKFDHTKIWLFPRLPRPVVAAWRRYRSRVDRHQSREAAASDATSPVTPSLPAGRESLTPRPLAPLPW